MLDQKASFEHLLQCLQERVKEKKEIKEKKKN